MIPLRRVSALVLLGLIASVSAPGVRAQDKGGRRFGVELDAENFPQKTPKECLASVVRAIDGRQIDYLLAQLADPAFVDQRVKTLGGDFRELVKETTERLAMDPTIVKELRRFAAEGMWEEGDDSATVKLKDVKAHTVFLKKIENRWYFENRQKPKEEPK
jgi:hypothetical protein